MLSELLAKHDQGDLLRGIAEAVLQLIMETDVEGIIGAGRHERSGERTTWRNGYGCAKKGSAKLSAHVEAILQSVQVLAFDVPAVAEYGGIRTELEAAGQTIGPNDLLIAAHSCSSGAVLVTDNTDEFARVRSLRVENWIR